MTEVAFAAGFGSIRRFNETFQALFDRGAGRAAASQPAGDFGGRARGSQHFAALSAAL